MTLTEYNELCSRWHKEDTGMRLGQWLMTNYLEVDDSEIFYCQDKSRAAALFFNRYIVTSQSGHTKSQIQSHSDSY